MSRLFETEFPPLKHHQEIIFSHFILWMIIQEKFQQ